jgi:hypothetical protein
MTSRNRQTLRNFFMAGKLPSQDHFGDLIDSTLNMTDEGFRKSPQNGLEISAPVGHDALISLYRDRAPQSPLWSISCNTDHDRLNFNSGGAPAAGDKTPPVLSLDAGAPDAGARVGVNTGAPRYALEVAGAVGSEGRIGTYPPPDSAPAIADGRWYSITPMLTGCQAFEVMAGTGRRGTGRFALLHAVALNTFNPDSGLLEFLSPRKRIRASNAYYGKRCDQLQLRWSGNSGDRAEYSLQIRTRCDYGGEQPGIRCFVTRLWFDEQMLERAP